MKTLLGASAAALALSFASITFADDPHPTHFGAWGFDLAGRDTSVTPGVDFYSYANGTYVKNLQIPPDAPSGPAVPIVITIGDGDSEPTATARLASPDPVAADSGFNARSGGSVTCPSR